MPKFRNIPRFTQTSPYGIDVFLRYVPSKIEEWEKDSSLNLDPDFQRGHVWTQDQQISYTEYVLRGGRSGTDFYFNQPGWMDDWKGPFVLVDGKQRLEAIRAFMENEIPAFGYLKNQYEDKIRMTTCAFRFWVNNLKTRKELLTWYLEMNSGGTPHTEAELDKVRNLLVKDMLS